MRLHVCVPGDSDPRPRARAGGVRVARKLTPSTNPHAPSTAELSAAESHVHPWPRLRPRSQPVEAELPLPRVRFFNNRVELAEDARGNVIDLFERRLRPRRPALFFRPQVHEPRFRPRFLPEHTLRPPAPVPIDEPAFLDSFEASLRLFREGKQIPARAHDERHDTTRNSDRSTDRRRHGSS